MDLETYQLIMRLHESVTPPSYHSELVDLRDFLTRQKEDFFIDNCGTTAAIIERRFGLTKVDGWFVPKRFAQSFNPDRERGLIVDLSVAHQKGVYGLPSPLYVPLDHPDTQRIYSLNAPQKEDETNLSANLGYR